MHHHIGSIHTWVVVCKTKTDLPAAIRSRLSVALNWHKRVFFRQKWQPHRSNLLSVILNNNEIRVFFVGVKKRDDIRRHGSNSTTHMTVVFRRETRKQYFSGVFCSWELAAANCVYLSRLSLCSLEIEQEWWLAHRSSFTEAAQQ